MEERDKLPFRKNCEGYFFNEKGEILAKKSDMGFVIFPGGGIEDNERIEDGMMRETLEETGAKIRGLRSLGVVNIKWSPNWAKTEKQKLRYEKFQGDEMHFFSGKVNDFIEQENKEEDFWEEEKFMDLDEVIGDIKKRLETEEEKDYIEAQIKFLTKLKEENSDVQGQA